MRTEIEFNKRAGIIQEMNDVPNFFKEEPSEPTGLKFTFNIANLSNFWKRLDDHNF
ncbi:MAG: hypothetical protein ACFE8J_13295 [Candidatus Heimdallarchaeota archaeon]